MLDRRDLLFAKEVEATVEAARAFAEAEPLLGKSGFARLEERIEELERRVEELERAPSEGKE